MAPIQKFLTWQSQVSELGVSYSLEFGNWIYVHAGFVTVAELSVGNDLTQLISVGSLPIINNIAAISDQGAIGTFQLRGTNLQAASSIDPGHKFILDFIVPLQSSN